MEKYFDNCSKNEEEIIQNINFFLEDNKLSVGYDRGKIVRYFKKLPPKIGMNLFQSLLSGGESYISILLDNDFEYETYNGTRIDFTRYIVNTEINVSVFSDNDEIRSVEMRDIDNPRHYIDVPIYINMDNLKERFKGFITSFVTIEEEEEEEEY
jgi:hypothetical protein